MITIIIFIDNEEANNNIVKWTSMLLAPICPISQRARTTDSPWARWHPSDELPCLAVSYMPRSSEESFMAIFGYQRACTNMLTESDRAIHRRKICEVENIFCLPPETGSDAPMSHIGSRKNSDERCYVISPRSSFLVPLFSLLSSLFSLSSQTWRSLFSTSWGRTINLYLIDWMGECKV